MQIRSVLNWRFIAPFGLLFWAGCSANTGEAVRTFVQDFLRESLAALLL